ncbi:MAG: hypothetical protein ACFFFC_00965 [Candidatus Thorarchaeota archaeon]
MPKPKAATNKVPIRNEVVVSLPVADGTIRRAIIRDKMVVEDPYLTLVRAKLHSIKMNATFAAEITSRNIKDIIIRQNIQT